MDLKNSFTGAKSTKFPTKPILGYPPHLKYVAALPWKTKICNFAIPMHVKHVSSVTFYHLSNRCLPNIIKINVKINTMQNTNILLFVRSLSSVLNVLKECVIAVWSDFSQVIADFAVDQWRKHFQACVRANVNKRLQTICIFMCFWFKWLLSIMSAFYCVDAWWSIGLPCLTAKL